MKCEIKFSFPLKSKKDNVPLFNEVRDLDYLYTFIFAVNIVVT